MHVLRFSIVFFACSLPASVSTADENPLKNNAQQPPAAVQQPAQPATTATKTKKKPADAMSPAEKLEEKQQKALAGFLMLGLVCIVFLFFVLAVTVTSSRFRKEVNRPLAKASQVDPLWYLKNRKVEGEEVTDEPL